MAGVEHHDGTRMLAVARRWDKVVVAIHTHRCSDAIARHLRAVVHKVVTRVSTVETYPRLTITDQRAGAIHYATDEHAFYLLCTAPSYPQRVAFRCLDEFKVSFCAKHLDAMHKSAEDGLSRDARPLLADTCMRYADAAVVDKVLGIQRDVEEVQGVMHDAVGRLLNNRENLEVLEDRADVLRNEGLSLANTGRRVRRDAQSRHRRLRLAVCLGVAAVLLVVLLPIIVTAAQAGGDAYATVTDTVGQWHDDYFGNTTADGKSASNATGDADG